MKSCGLTVCRFQFCLILFLDNYCLLLFPKEHVQKVLRCSLISKLLLRSCKVQVEGYIMLRMDELNDYSPILLSAHGDSTILPTC